MSERFNRNDANVPDDRLFPDDFITDQNGQDEDLLQIAADFGCLPCIGKDLVVSSKSETYHKVEVSTGWAYDLNGHRITLEDVQDREAELEDTSGDNNYIILSHQDDYDTPRNAHRTGKEYQTRKKDFFLISVSTSTPGINDIVLANCKQTGTGPITIIDDVWPNRLVRTCKLIPHSSIPEVAEEEGTGTGAKPPPPGSKPELPDYPKGRKVPMPIILSGTRSGSDFNGLETVLPEELGRVPAVVDTIILERVNLKSGTPVADVKIWIGDWGPGAPHGDTGDDRFRCDFSSTESGAVWDDDLWISNEAGYYYLVKSDESWYAKIVDSGPDWVQVEIDEEENNVIPGSGTYYVCPYADIYRVQTIPYKNNTDPYIARAHTIREGNRVLSPTAPIVTAKELNLGGKYKLKVASIISGDNYTKWVETDFIVGQDLIDCWVPASENLTVESVDGGVQVTVPGISEGIEPDAYEACFNFGTGETIADPSFDDSTHPTLRFRERVFKLDIPPGYKVKVVVRAIFKRLVMLCGDPRSPKVITHSDEYVLSGGVGLRRNRKIFTNPIKEDNIPAEGTALVDQQKIPNPIWPKSIALFNPTADTQKDFEVYVHGSNQNYTLGRKIRIGSGGVATEMITKSWVEQPISDYRITDNGVMITIKNIHTTNDQSFDLRYTVEYCEDSEEELGKMGQA